MPELAVIRFTVYDYDVRSKNDFVGAYSVPVTCIAEGESLQVFRECITMEHKSC